MRERKRTQRLYREEGLAVRRRKNRKRALGTRAPLVIEAVANVRWSVDFVHDQFADGRRFVRASPEPCMDGSRVTRGSVMFGIWSGAAMYSASRLRFFPRALMSVRVWLGSRSMARA